MPDDKIPQKTLTFYQQAISETLLADDRLSVNINVRDWDDKVAALISFTIPAELRPMRAIMISPVTLRFLQHPEPE
ncbi:hypothetical protein ES708_21160 [subsurface metagenome]